jgi:hypothetical protein
MGLEADIDWANIEGSSTIAARALGQPVSGCVQRINQHHVSQTAKGACRLRAGQLAILILATGGAAILGAKADLRTAVGGRPVCGQSVSQLFGHEPPC